MSRFGEYLWLFIIYAFLGWLLETVFAAIRQKKFINRGFLNGPFCILYGIAAVLMTVFFRELRNHILFLFLGCAVTASAVALVGGILLERFGSGKWWDYSGRKGNLGGYVCAAAAAFWGASGTAGVLWLNPLLLWLYRMLPGVLRGGLLTVFAVLLSVDYLGSLMAVRILRKTPKITAANDRIERFTQKLGHGIETVIRRRLGKAYPNAFPRREKKKTTVFAEGCGFYKLFLILVIGAFLGDIVETLFVRATAGVWMSRSGLVWGQFSLVWGIAMALASGVLYRYRERSDGFLFLFGTVFGGVYEYCCSVFTEIVFGTVFWDYSAIPFNLGGRINLLYCFFWGVAAVVWIRAVYPVVSRWIEKLPIGFGKALTWSLVVFLTVDIGVTCLAMTRYTQRQRGVEAGSFVAAAVDRMFPDDWMEHRFQNMVLVEEK